MSSCKRCHRPNLDGIEHADSHGVICSQEPRAPFVPSHESTHDDARNIAEVFATFEYVGQMPSEDPATGAPVALLLANCPSCHSTIARVVPAGSPEATANRETADFVAEMARAS